MMHPKYLVEYAAHMLVIYMILLLLGLHGRA